MDPNDMVVMTEEEMRNVRVRKKDTESLHRLFPDLPYQRRILEFDDPEYERAKENGTLGDFFEENKKLLHEQEERAKQNKIDVQSCIYRGKLFNTYLMFEYNEDVYIVDQHAAHERIIFDRLKEKMKNREIVKQPMLVPFELKINAFESAFIREKLTEIADMGFDIQDGGDGLFIVNAIPADLHSIDLSVFFNEILANVNNYRAIKLEELLKDKLASAACKAAVKGGMNLGEGEVIELLRQMDGDMGLKCPHGRPVVVKMTRTQIEKMFKRIV
jgi:DNA mismatch repair ATPase MutL